MNRLVLIGNGFDLAHNFKTKYCDFVLFYLCESINNAFSKKKHSDPLLTIECVSLYPQQYSWSVITPEMVLQKFESLKQNDDFHVTIHSDLLKSTLDKLDKLNWVDLEDEYFNKLLKCRIISSFDKAKVDKLNNEFSFLKKRLQFYLKKVQEESTGVLIDDYKELFYQYINPNEILLDNLYKAELPNKILFLSFNYTNIVEKYIKPNSSNMLSEVNYIHGQVENTLDSIIFGFGDEFNKEYLSFEDVMQNELFTFVKSFGYSKSDNYWKLIRFLQEDKYQVYILGHSLGLTDRTMLKEIFEHEKCVSIKIFYWNKGNGQHDHTEKMYDMSRHFTDKGSMRKKVVPFNMSKPMPQL